MNPCILGTFLPMTKPYISLQEASRLTPYDANYLGLLVRKNRLPAIKRDGKWYTTKESILQYLDQVNQKSPGYETYSNSMKKSLGTGLTLVSSIFVSLMIIIAIIIFIFAESASSEKDTFKIIQNENTVYSKVKFFGSAPRSPLATVASTHKK